MSWRPRSGNPCQRLRANSACTWITSIRVPREMGRGKVAWTDRYGNSHDLDLPRTRSGSSPGPMRETSAAQAAGQRVQRALHREPVGRPRRGGRSDAFCAAASTRSPADIGRPRRDTRGDAPGHPMTAPHADSRGGEGRRLRPMRLEFPASGRHRAARVAGLEERDRSRRPWSWTALLAYALEARTRSSARLSFDDPRRFVAFVPSRRGPQIAQGSAPGPDAEDHRFRR